MGRIAANVRRLREAGAWTQEDVAARAGGMSERLYRLIESGKTNVTAATLTRLAEAFAVDVSELLTPPTPTSTRSRTRSEAPAGPSIAPSVVATLLLDPATLREPTVLAALEALLRRRVELDRVGNPGAATGAARSNASDEHRESASSVPAETTVAVRGAPTVVVVPTVAVAAGLRAFVIALLVSNPSGLTTSEMMEAISTTKRRPRKNEIHELVRSLQESGDLRRMGRRGSYVYVLRGDPSR
jgi:transcriptional regulator with XRE-family HTH domain